MIILGSPPTGFTRRVEGGTGIVLPPTLHESNTYLQASLLHVLS